jgi:hypothetical protein
VPSQAGRLKSSAASLALWDLNRLEEAERGYRQILLKAELEAVSFVHTWVSLAGVPASRGRLEAAQQEYCWQGITTGDVRRAEAGYGQRTCERDREARGRRAGDVPCPSVAAADDVAHRAER